ncbi:MAG TPA: hypothetical protein VI643_00385, partial [Planctomycetota bacterium]|nr:hypothetical protein [Planctomycetota bacterium]
TIGSIASRGRYQVDADVRMRRLELQSLAVESVLTVAADKAVAWGEILNLLALNWLREAEFTRIKDPSEGMDPSMRFDQYGNIYYAQAQAAAPVPNQPAPIASGKLLDARPSPAWLARLRPDLRPKLIGVYASMFLKVNEPEQAFPYIEQLARPHPAQALELAHGFLDVWAVKNDPNRDAKRTNRYMYMYGYNPRAASIPLTRSKQQRNLAELAQWVARLRALPIGEIDEERLARAFTASHSVAEVYRLKDIEQVFGAIDSLKAETLGEVLQTMRRNLGSVWRDSKVQTEKQTKRKDAEIEAEVFRGYQVAREVLGKALEKYPNHWALQLAEAAIAFDENTYLHELTRSPEFSAKRNEAFALFRKAAELYARSVPELKEDKEKADVYLIWFYASLGFSDLEGLKDEHSPELSQPPLIRQAILELPGPAAERHQARFANLLSTRITAVKPELKHRYLKHGLRVCEGHKQAREAQKLFAYYDDLVSEIKLSVQVDGSTRVGRDKAFGVFVDIRHTREIERESGGFQKYLQNQQSGYYWNFGRPTVNYRERFEEMARKALADSFDVLSVTFHEDKISARGDAEAGWTRTPYAYLLLKPKGAQVDELPPLHLNLDFLDTSGFCVLPVESSRVPIQVASGGGEARPYLKLKIVQTLDERKAAEGVLVLEVKASANGLVPELEEILTVALEGFLIEKIDNPGVSVVRMDAESAENSAVSERNWVLKLVAKDGSSAPTQMFKFPGSKIPDAELVFQRYKDADLVDVPRELALEGRYGPKGPVWPWILAGVGLMAVAAVALRIRRSRAKGPESVSRSYELPSSLTPFSVWNLLRRIRGDARLAAELRAPLDDAISGLEQQYFSLGDGNPPDLQRVAEEWVRKIG